MNMPNMSYLLNMSPWPFLISISILNLTMNIHLMLNNLIFSLYSILVLLLILYQWIRDLNRESLYMGNHTKLIMSMTKTSILLFILSEVFLFISLFWAFLSQRLSPDIMIGGIWPPKNIVCVNPMDLPLLNTIILISSGAFITWCHNSISKKNLKSSKLSLNLTIMSGIYFLMCMTLEYKLTFFTFSDSCFGSLFFLITGFHGSHVIIGMLMLWFSKTRLMDIQFSNKHHVSLEFAIWYWHFVDVVWLFVYGIVYWMSAYLMTNIRCKRKLISKLNSQ